MVERPTLHATEYNRNNFNFGRNARARVTININLNEEIRQLIPNEPNDDEIFDNDILQPEPPEPDPNEFRYEGDEDPLGLGFDMD